MLKNPIVVAFNFLLVALAACSNGAADLHLSEWSNANVKSDNASDTVSYMNTWMLYQVLRVSFQ